MRKLIRIENGALNRDPLPIGWARYERVLESNPELHDAVSLSQEFRNNVIHSSSRPVFFFQAMRAGKISDLRRFMKEFDPEYQPNSISAATQARMRLAGWRSDETVKINTDKILGNVVEYFNAFLDGKTLADNFVWNPKLGEVRNKEGRWVAPDRPIRFDRAYGLTMMDMRRVRGEIEATHDQLVAIARKLLRERRATPNKPLEFEPLGMPKKLDHDEFEEFLEPADTLRERLESEMNRRLVERAAPPNLGMPIVEGYPGIREAIIDRDRQVEEFVGQISEEIQSAASRSTDKISARMIVITPELAEQWLSKQINTRNRKIQKNHIKGIARDIANERWMVNAQPISFTADPFDPEAKGRLRLLNGQHRLYAVVEAGMPIEAPIAVNIPEEAFATYDVHAKRQIRPTTNSIDNRVLAAAARLQWKEDNNLKLLEASTSPTASELMDTIEAHPGLAHYYPRSRRAGMQDIGSSGVLTYFFYRTSREASDLSPQFLDTLESGEGLGGNPALALREDLIKAGRISRRETLAHLLRGWNAYKTWARKEEAKKDQQEMF